MTKARWRFSIMLLGTSVGAGALLIGACATSHERTDPRADASLVVPSLDAGSDVASEAETGCGDDAHPCPLSCAEADLCPVPTGVSARFLLTAISGSSASDVWAVGSGGTVLRYDGSAWTIVPSGVPLTFHAVWADGVDVWLVSASKSILRARVPSSGSLAWTPAPATGPNTAGGRLLSVWGFGSELHFGGEPLADFDDVSGESISGNWLVYGAGGVAGSDAGVDGGDGGAEAGGDAGAPPFRVMNGFGDRFASCTVTALWGKSLSDRWAACDNGDEASWMRGLILHGETAGPGATTTWTSVDSQSTARLHALSGTASSVWAVGDVGTLRKWSSGASRFAIVPSGTTETLRGVWAIADDDVWAVGDGGTILHYDGTAVRAATIAWPGGPRPDLRAVWASGPNDVWIAGDGPLLHYTGPKARKDGGT